MSPVNYGKKSVNDNIGPWTSMSVDIVNWVLKPHPARNVGMNTIYQTHHFFISRVWYSWVAGSTDAYLRTLFHYFQSVLKDDLHYLG